MKRLALLVVLAVVPASMVLAQSTLDDEINAELDRMYQSSGRNSPSVQVNVQASPTQTQTSGQVQDSQTASSATTTQASNIETRTVQKQPTTVIEASPLTDSRAERLRKARQDAELQTEEKLVERIEHSRLEDERRRSEVLFGDRFNSLMQKAEQKAAADQKATQQQVIVNENYGVQGDVTQGAAQTSAQAVQQEQVAVPVVVAPEVKAAPIYVPVPVVIREEDKKDDKHEHRDEVRHEDRHEDRHEHVRHEIREELVKKEIIENRIDRPYIAGMVGFGDYPDVQNIRSNYSLGTALGMQFDNRILVEGSFMFSNFSIEQIDSGPAMPINPVFPRITEMDQYSFGGALKYQFLSGMIRPVVGGLVSYSYRTYKDVQLGFGNNDASSHAVDLGAMAGLDIEVTRSFTIGGDVRYMTNIYNRASNDGFQRRFSQQVTGIGTPIEELDFVSFTIMGRATF